jgi:rare lipoprotein A (peptidoglycan hydrolase)
LFLLFDVFHKWNKVAGTLVSQAEMRIDALEKHRYSNLASFVVIFVLTTGMPCWASDHVQDSKKPSKLSRVFKGVASFYGKKFQGKRTASGKPFDMNAFTCAHPNLPFGTPVLVQNEETGAQCQVIVNDRGPYVRNRCIDLSKAAANKLGITGVAKVVCKTGRYVANGFDRKKTPKQVASHQ